MIDRPNYLNDLISFKEKDLIKIVTGIRRCGKSTLFDLYIEYLISTGINKNQIIRMNLEEYEFNNIISYDDLYNYVNSKLVDDKMNYVFINEVQRITNFQKAVDSLYIKKNVDLYITGSNSKLLSGELATLLSGRYVEIKMLPLSFKEYISYTGENDVQKKYVDYITKSSFPYTLKLESAKEIRMYLDGLFNTVIVNDISERKEISDIGMLKDVIKFMFDNVGNLCSSTSIANTMTSNGRKISVPTVEKYLEALVESFVLYKVSRYDIKGKNYLTTGSKYYLSDIGLRYYLLGSKNTDDGHILENIVYLELLRRGYEVYIGKNDDNEVDFVAVNERGEEYYQVAYTVKEKKTLERELKPLNNINDHNPKFLLTTDYTPYTSHNGIKQINVFDWLLDK
ncbi:MAG: ATP-binding protein [Bacilli bacterium]|nr:ATP-binding protein [Bacilli bacterium]